MNFNVKQTFFKRLSRKKLRFSLHVKHKSLSWKKNYPLNNYMFKIDIKSTRTRCEICSKLTIKKPDVFSIVDFEHVLICWIITFISIVWVIFIIFIIFNLFMICKKMELDLHSKISLGVSHILIFVRNGS